MRERAGASCLDRPEISIKICLQLSFCIAVQRFIYSSIPSNYFNYFHSLARSFARRSFGVFLFPTHFARFRHSTQDVRRRSRKEFTNDFNKRINSETYHFNRLSWVRLSPKPRINEPTKRAIWQLASQPASLLSCIYSYFSSQKVNHISFNFGALKSPCSSRLFIVVDEWFQ